MRWHYAAGCQDGMRYVLQLGLAAVGRRLKERAPKNFKKAPKILKMFPKNLKDVGGGSVVLARSCGACMSHARKQHPHALAVHLSGEFGVFISDSGIPAFMPVLPWARSCQSPKLNIPPLAVDPPPWTSRLYNKIKQDDKK